MEYQVELKQYITDKNKYKAEIQRCFNIIMGQCSPTVERNLEGDDSYAELRSKADSIGLIKLLEKICYNYRAHEYKPLGAWTSITKLSTLVQPEGVHETKHYDTFRSTVEMCKASGVNFATMCNANIDIAMTTLRDEHKITTTGTFSEGAYHNLTADERKLVDEMAEEIQIPETNKETEETENKCGVQLQHCHPDQGHGGPAQQGAELLCYA